MADNHIDILHWPVLSFLSILLACGLTGNIIILYIYQRRMKATIFGFFVQILAAVDLTTVLVAIPGSITFRSGSKDFDPSRICKFLFFMIHFLSLTSGFLLCIIAIQRYRKVCCPHGRQITKRLAAKLCLGVICIAFALSLPIIFLVGVTDTTVFFRNTSIIIPVCDYDSNLKLNGQSIMYAFLVDGEFLGIAVILSSLYFLIGKSLRQRSTSQNARGRPQATVGTKVFATLTTIFIMSVLPLMIISTIFSFYRTPPVLNYLTKTLFDIGCYLPYMNSIVNPIVYSFNSRLFRQECLSLWPCARKRKPEECPPSKDDDDTPTCTTSL